MIEVDSLRASEDGEWDAFLRGNPAALHVHSTAYRDLVAEELGCQPDFLVAREAGVIRGVLPAMWAGEPGARVWNSLPYYGSHGGPVADGRDAESALVEAWNQRATDPATLAATMIANPFLDRAAPPPVHQLTDERISQFTVLPAGGGEDELMARISREARNNVRRARRRGVSVGRASAAVAEVARINRANMEALGVPAKSKRLFSSIPGRFPPGEGSDVWLARVDGEVVAALLLLRFNGVAEYFASGTRPEFRRHDPHSALVFEAMAAEAARGTRIWNWGGTQDGMTGVFNYKRKWGTSQGRYRYHVHVNDRSLLGATPAELLERFPGFYVLPFSALESDLAARTT